MTEGELKAKAEKVKLYYGKSVSGYLDAGLIIDEVWNTPGLTGKAKNEWVTKTLGWSLGHADRLRFTARQFSTVANARAGKYDLTALYLLVGHRKESAEKMDNARKKCENILAGKVKVSVNGKEVVVTFITAAIAKRIIDDAFNNKPAETDKDKAKKGQGDEGDKDDANKPLDYDVEFSDLLVKVEAMYQRITEARRKKATIKKKVKWLMAQCEVFLRELDKKAARGEEVRATADE
jgi:hypothetical protein